MDRHSTVVLAAWVTIAANAAWFAAIAYLHLVERDLHPATRYVSEYVLTRSGWVMTAAFAIMAAGALCLALAFALTGWRTLPLALAIAAYGVTMGAAGWYPTDPSTGTAPQTESGALHNGAARWVYLSIAGAALLGVAYGALRVRPFDRVDWPWLLVSAAVIAGYLLTHYGWRWAAVGLLQRTFLAAVLVWLTLAAVRLVSARGG